jgi:hypothetical protein
MGEQLDFDSRTHLFPGTANELSFQLAQSAFRRSDQVINRWMARISARTSSLGRPRLCRIPDYAASSVTLALKEPSLMRHNFAVCSGPDNGLFGRRAGSRWPNERVIPIIALHPERAFRRSGLPTSSRTSRWSRIRATNRLPFSGKCG